MSADVCHTFNAEENVEETGASWPRGKLAST